MTALMPAAVPTRRAVLGAALVIACLFAGPPAASADGRSAYTTNFNDASVSVIDTESSSVAKTFDVGFGPTDMAITPDGARGFVTDYFNGQTSSGGAVTVINTRTNRVLDREIALDGAPIGIAMAPDGRRAYVSRFSADAVSVINTETLKVVGDPIAVGDQPSKISISPDGAGVYVSNTADGTISVIDPQTREVVDEIEDIENPNAVGFTPNSQRAFAAAFDSDEILELDPQTNEFVGDPIPVGDGPAGVAVSSSGERAYVSNVFGGSVSVVDTLGNATVGDPIETSNFAGAVAVAPAGIRRAYVTNDIANSVSVIDTDTNEVVGDPIAVPGGPNSITIAPNGSPAASLAVRTRVQTGQQVDFDASASSDDVGIQTFGLDFGDGTDEVSAEPAFNHVYEQAGTYEAVLTVDDGEGCSGFVATGSTPLCNGSSVDTVAVEVVVTDDPPPPFSLGLGVGLTSPLRQVAARVECRNADCEGKARGTLEVKRKGQAARRFPLRPQSFSGEAGSVEKVTLQISRKARRAAGKALRSGGSVAASVVARASDGFDTDTARKRLRLKG